MIDSSKYSADFGRFDGRAWMNAAHQGPLPNVALEAGQHALADKHSPHRVADDSFIETPRRLRDALARLIGVAADDIVLGNSASYGLALLAAGMPWRSGDEVLFVRGEFPATVFPWRLAERFGVTLRFIDARIGNAPDADEVAAQLGDRTRVFCASWVNSFSGHTIDVDAVATACRSAGTCFVLNASQGLGAHALDVRAADIDVLICCGYKWLLGPYGTGFAWVRPALREQLRPPHAYWLPNVWGRDGGMTSYALRRDLGARAFDLFDTANFLNFAPWTAAIEYLLKAGTATVAHHDQALVERLIDGVPPERYEFLSPRSGERRSALVVLRPTDGRSADLVHGALTSGGVDTAVREGCVRFSPHLYNTFADIDRAIRILEH